MRFEMIFLQIFGMKEEDIPERVDDELNSKMCQKASKYREIRFVEIGSDTLSLKK